MNATSTFWPSAISPSRSSWSRPTPGPSPPGRPCGRPGAGRCRCSGSSAGTCAAGRCGGCRHPPARRSHRCGADHLAGLQRHEHLAGVHGGLLLDAGADDRRLGPQQRHGLALHVGAHQRAVGVVVLQERNQRGGNRDDLLGRNVHVLDVIGRLEQELLVAPHRDTRFGEMALLIRARVRLGDGVAIFLVGRQEADLVGRLPARCALRAAHRQAARSARPAARRSRVPAGASTVPSGRATRSRRILPTSSSGWFGTRLSTLRYGVSMKPNSLILP